VATIKKVTNSNSNNIIKRIKTTKAIKITKITTKEEERTTITRRITNISNTIMIMETATATIMTISNRTIISPKAMLQCKALLDWAEILKEREDTSNTTIIINEKRSFEALRKLKNFPFSFEKIAKFSFEIHSWLSLYLYACVWSSC